MPVMPVEEAARLARMQYARSYGPDDPAWRKFLETMRKKSDFVIEEWAPMYFRLGKVLGGELIFANGEHLVITTPHSDFGPISISTLNELRRIEQDAP